MKRAVNMIYYHTNFEWVVMGARRVRRAGADPHPVHRNHAPRLWVSLRNVHLQMRPHPSCAHPSPTVQASLIAA